MLIEETLQLSSRILLVVLSTGEAYICDLRKGHRSRVELLETLSDEANGDEENHQLIRHVSGLEPPLLRF